MTDRTLLRKTVILKAPPATVWDWLTQPDKLAQWFHPPRTPLVEGARLEMFGAQSGDLLVWGEVLTARAPEFLEYSFTIKPMGEAVSHVRWTLQEVSGGTRLTLEHEGMPDGPATFGTLLAIDKGWDGHLGDMRAKINDS